MSQYLDTQLIECNRLHSEEAKAGNNNNTALFTNKIGSGINLDVGDTISVHGAYISEVGAAGNTIEFKGASLGKIKEYQISNVANTLPYAEGDTNKRINGFKRTRINVEPVKRELFDNKASVKIGFYINAMGQNTIQLPRRFGNNNLGNEAFKATDTVSNGLPFYSKEVLVKADYKAYLGGDTIFKQKIDNTRFTLFAREESVFDKDSDFTGDGVDNLWINYGTESAKPLSFVPMIKEAAFWHYNEFSELIDLEVNSGFNTALNVADELTNQLKQPLKENVFTQRIYDETKDIFEPVTRTIESHTYKPFNCASIGNLTVSKYNDFHSACNTTAVSQLSYDYLSNFQYVAYKRPEIQRTGRALPGLKTLEGQTKWRGLYVYKTIKLAQKLTSEIVIELEYNETNCKLFDDFFKAQELYPELWNDLDFRKINEGTTYDRDKIKYESSRWLHLNKNMSKTYTDNGFDFAFLGGDNTIVAGQFMIQEAPPVFFEYDSATKDSFFISPDKNKLSYGCMDRIKISSSPDVYYIKFHTEKVGGIPEFFFINQPLNGVNEFIIRGQEDFSGSYSGRSIGFDFSYSAWSTVALAPFAGYNIEGFEDAWSPGYQDQAVANFSLRNLSDKLSQVYLGSVDPLISYDSSSNRFKISKLHTLLRQQQTFIAGRPAPKVDDLGPATAGAEVFKMNPIDDFWLYTPDLIPLRSEQVHSGVPYPRLNQNLESWLIYDSYCGIFIDDFGFDGDEGLWNVLGFTNEQFDSPLTASNTLANIKIDNINKYNLNRVTTNAQLISKDYPAFIQNQYGANMFTQQIVTVQAIDTGGTGPSFNVFSPITIAQDSIEIVARNLPRRMLRPYYLLKSNIIDYNSLIGSNESGQNFNVAAIIDKQYSGGDFFFFTANSIQFTVTKPMTITSIKNSIHDPDGSFSTVNDDSSIIYQIQKTKNLANLDVLSQILQNKKQK